MKTNSESGLIYNKTDSILQTATHIPPLLTRIEAIEEKNRRKLLKRTLWLSGGLLIAFFFAVYFVGINMNLVTQITSVPYAVSSETGCKAMGGQLANSENQKLCVFPMK